MKTEHTPSLLRLPLSLHASHFDHGIHCVAICDKSGRVVAGSVAKDDAQDLMHICNNHERLVEALKSFVVLYDQGQLQLEGDNGNDPVITQARTILKEINE